MEGFIKIEHLKTERGNNAKSPDSNNHEKIDIGNNLFQCKCGKSYKYSKKLKYHIMTSNGEKPHKCEICKKDFVLASDLKTHERTHSGDLFQSKEISKSMKNHTQKKTPFYVRLVGNASDCNIICKFMKKFIQVKNHLSVKLVASFSNRLLT